MVALSRAHRHMDVNDIVVAGASTHKPDGARGVRRHYRDVYVPRLQQPGKSDLAGAAPCLSNDSDWYAESSAAA
jgi:hypothetical protein